MKYFNIPGPQTHFVLNTYLLHLFEVHPEYFLPNTKVSSVFGNFQYCIWDGGRNFAHYNQASEEEILDIKEAYNHFLVPVRFVFTNPILEKKHLDDRFGNLCLEIFHDNKNEIVVNSPLMEDYIREKYPKYKIVSSTTKRITNPDKFIEELKNPDYYQVCLDYDLNKNMELINSIPKELRIKCEFLINAICPPHCPQRKEHYAKTGHAHLTYLRDRYQNDKCGITESSIHPSVLGKGNNFTIEEVNQYHDLGYRYFKLEGRTLQSLDVLLMYCYYMIKPEWWFDVIREAYGTEGAIINSPNDEQQYIRVDKKEYIIGL